MRFVHVIGFMVEALAILLAAKVVRDLVLKRRGFAGGQGGADKPLVGPATTQAGYLIGVMLGFLGAVSGRAENATFLGTAAFVALAGLMAIALQLVADIVSDRLIFGRGAEGKNVAIAEDVNVALAVGKAAVSIATGFVLRGAMLNPESSLLGRIGWFAAAQAVMVAAVLVYCRLTPYDDRAEIRRNNLAAGFPIAGILLAVGLVMEAAIVGRPSGSAALAALETAKFLGISLVLLYLLRVITDLVMLPKVKLARAIAEERNVAAGIQEGLSFLLAALIVTFFLT